MAELAKKEDFLAIATGKYIRISPQKCRLIIDLIRGKYVGEALSILKFLKKRKASRIVEKVLRSAVSNAQQKNPQIDVDNLIITNAYVNQGPFLKRFRPAAFGRAHRILKRTSHITICLEEKKGR
jgi:large subunit ribosomal protein L22